MRALTRMGIKKPSRIQGTALPLVLRDPFVFPPSSLWFLSRSVLWIGVSFFLSLSLPSFPAQPAEPDRPVAKRHWQDTVLHHWHADPGGPLQASGAGPVHVQHP